MNRNLGSQLCFRSHTVFCWIKLFPRRKFSSQRLVRMYSKPRAARFLGGFKPSVFRQKKCLCQDSNLASAMALRDSLLITKAWSHNNSKITRVKIRGPLLERFWIFSLLTPLQSEWIISQSEQRFLDELSRESRFDLRQYVRYREVNPDWWHSVLGSSNTTN